MTKKLVGALLLSFLITIPVFSDIQDDFDNLVDFSVTLEKIDEAVAAGREAALDTGKIVIVDGAISAIQIINPEPESFVAEFELVDGKWQGLEDVQMFSSIIRVSGEDFAARIPARRSRRAIPNEIKANSHVLVVGTLSELRRMSNGSTTVVMDGFYVRPID